MELINLQQYPVKNVLSALLKDKTTKQNIIFATDAYSEFNIDAKDQITEEVLFGLDSVVIQPRVSKSLEEQAERTKKKAEVKWVYRAYESVYGYEFQGDNLLIARINLLNTFADYMQDRWERKPKAAELKKVTNIIVWNLWQMDGITGTVPFGKPKEINKQLTFFDYAQGINDTETEEVDCKIYDWRSNNSLTYRSIKEG